MASSSVVVSRQLPTYRALGSVLLYLAHAVCDSDCEHDEEPSDEGSDGRARRSLAGERHSAQSHPYTPLLLRASFSSWSVCPDQRLALRLVGSVAVRAHLLAVTQDPQAAVGPLAALRAVAAEIEALGSSAEPIAAVESKRKRKKSEKKKQAKEEEKKQKGDESRKSRRLRQDDDEASHDHEEQEDEDKDEDEEQEDEDGSPSPPPRRPTRNRRPVTREGFVDPTSPGLSFATPSAVRKSPSKRKAAPPPKMEELDLAAAGAGEESARTAGEGKKKQKRSTRSQRK
eukprot:COSAG06_NODE_445_length_15690_cov_28.448849_3_plen_286_part_00